MKKRMMLLLQSSRSLGERQFHTVKILLSITKLKPLIFCLALTFTLALYSAEFKKLEPQDKLKDKELSFAVTFDTFTTKADFAQGKNISTTLPDVSLGLRGTVGFDRAQGFLPEGGEQLFFPAQDNISVKAGTVIFWVNAADYEPSKALTDGKCRDNIALFEFMAQNKETHLVYRLYEFKDKLYFDVWLKQNVNPSTAAIGTRDYIRKKQWHQIAITWNELELQIFVDGEFHNRTTVVQQIGNVISTMVMDPEQSYFGIPFTVWGQERSRQVLFDDLKVYGRVLSKLEIRKRYRELEVQSVKTTEDEMFETSLSGIDRTQDCMLAEFDFGALPDRYSELLEKKQLKFEYTLSGPDNFVQQGTLTPDRTAYSMQLSGAEKEGDYVLEVFLPDNESKTAVSKAKIYKPDLSFMNNQIGFSDKVPAPWTAVKLEDRTVSVWNRTYEFKTGIFPEKITVAGKNLLVKAPELNIMLLSGKADIVFTAGTTFVSEREAVLSGSAVFGDGKYRLNYKTSIAYDGLIKSNFVIHGSPEIVAMTLDWQMEKAAVQYLMTPILYQGNERLFAAPYPQSSSDKEPTQLWFTSEKNGGFAYAMENDANWSYPVKYPVFKANTETGKCSVTMIAQETRLPEATDYQAIFIATPTRPLAELSRNVRFTGSSAVSDRCAAGLDGNHQLWTAATDGIFADGPYSYRPAPVRFEQKVKDYPENSIGVYGMADSLSTLNPVGAYLSKYYEIPGAYTYTFEVEKWDDKIQSLKKVQCFSLPACSRSSNPDYFLRNQKELLTGPGGDRIWMIYYDLCENRLCANPRHGCGFVDKLGRPVKTFQLLSKRRLFERSITLAHQLGRVVLLHAQRRFNPILHGMGDYWYPGEQNDGLVARNQKCFTQDLTDDIWRSEYNKNTLGINVLFLPSNGGWRKHVCEAVLMQCGLHDIEMSSAWCPFDIVDKVWKIKPAYGVDSTTPFHVYYEQKEVVSSSPDVKISYYSLGAGKYLFILGNRTDDEITTELDFSVLKIADGILREEYTDTDMTIKDSKLQITVPQCGFRILGFPPKQIYPYQSNCSSKEDFWKPKTANVQSRLDFSTGHDKPGALCIEVASDHQGQNGIYSIKKPLVPGRFYKMTIWAKGENLNPESKIVLRLCSHNLGPFANLISRLTPEWEKYEIQGTAPTNTVWAKANQLQVLLDFQNLNGGKIWFDDIEIMEHESETK